MPRVKRNTDATLNLQCDDPEDKFTASYTNMGEPFRDGISIGIENEEFDKHVTVMLCNSEAIQLRNLLLEHYPINAKVLVGTSDGDSIKVLAERQFDWVERMNWHNKTVLEALALISSEVGEAVNECRGEKPTEKLGEELADIILRTLDLAQWQGIDISKAISDKMDINEVRGTRGRAI